MKRYILIALLLSTGLYGCWFKTDSTAQTSVAVQVPAPTIADSSPETAALALPLVDAAGLDVAEKRTIDVYERVAPSVVSVSTEVLQYGFFDVYTQAGSGSGFVLDAAGHILTNYHVVEGAQSDSLEVIFGDNTRLQAELVGVDPRNDLAVLRVNPDEAPLVPVELGNSADLQVGQRAVAIGNPFGEFSQTLTTGVISALNRTLEGPENLDITGIIQTDASINRGNSGGPLLDSAGRVIGINTAIFSPSGTSAGVGFSVPIDTVKRLLPDLLALGYYRHPWLGIGPRSAYTLNAGLARALGLASEQGLLLVDIADPLAVAGVRGADQRLRLGNTVLLAGGDVLVAVNDHAVKDYNDLATYLSSYQVGDEVTVRLLRGQEHLELRVPLAEQPLSQ